MSVFLHSQQPTVGLGTYVGYASAGTLASGAIFRGVRHLTHTPPVEMDAVENVADLDVLSYLSASAPKFYAVEVKADVTYAHQIGDWELSEPASSDVHPYKPVDHTYALEVSENMSVLPKLGDLAMSLGTADVVVESRSAFLTSLLDVAQGIALQAQAIDYASIRLYLGYLILLYTTVLRATVISAVLASAMWLAYRVFTFTSHIILIVRILPDLTRIIKATSQHHKERREDILSLLNVVTAYETHLRTSTSQVLSAVEVLASVVHDNQKELAVTRQQLSKQTKNSSTKHRDMVSHLRNYITHNQHASNSFRTAIAKLKDDDLAGHIAAFVYSSSLEFQNIGSQFQHLGSQIRRLDSGLQYSHVPQTQFHGQAPFMGFGYAQGQNPGAQSGFRPS